jgi:hypothetical protein
MERVLHMPFDSLVPRGPRRHPMLMMPLPVEHHAPSPYIALTMFSVIFLASPSSIMVLSR